MVRGFGLAFESNQVSIPAMGSYCLATLMSSDRTKQICLWMTIYIYIYIGMFESDFLVRTFTYLLIVRAICIVFESVCLPNYFFF